MLITNKLEFNKMPISYNALIQYCSFPKLCMKAQSTIEIKNVM
ncbi:hypothetical protein KSS87_002651 [Heliosperma pusillum]|nr:hypothetical protein KSS87_002651 [Heliosperma pusillum]